VTSEDPQLTSADGERTVRGWLLIVRGLGRAAMTTTVLVALYYALPLEVRSDAYVVLELVLGVVVLAGMIAWQVRAIIRARSPAIRATQALASTTALFLLLFASAYYILSAQDAATFSEPLSRSDAIYFTVTIFATVGFGDVAAHSEMARLLVTGQMLLDLVVLGLGIQVILGAVQRGRAN
jgi:voltage-gated potassium channel